MGLCGEHSIHKKVEWVFGVRASCGARPSFLNNDTRKADEADLPNF